MSWYSGVHHILKERQHKFVGKSYCGRTLASGDMSIDLTTAIRLQEENGKARPCQKCMDKANED